MSILNKCKEYEALPFYGFPVKPSFEEGNIVFEFPEGYSPNGSRTQEVADKLARIVSGDIIKVTPNIVKVKPNMEMFGELIYGIYINSK